MNKIVGDALQATAWQHKTVLLHEAVDALLSGQQRQSETREPVFVDATFGRGGHSRLILAHLHAAQRGRLIAFDKDPEAIAAGAEMKAGVGGDRFDLIHASYAEAAAALAQRGVVEVAGVLMDLGISSPQIDVAERGFSFRMDGPLDMRMDTTQGMTAAAWLSVVDEATLREVIKDYGEERYAFQIAKAIITRRDDAARPPIASTRELAQIVAGAVKTSWRDKGQDPATRTFQAIRIFINRELEELQVALNQYLPLLALGARLVVISFHSLEDRLVKRFLQFHSQGPVIDRRVPLRAADMPQSLMHLLGKRAPSTAEIAANPRSRSAIMRIAERTAEPLLHWYPQGVVNWPDNMMQNRRPVKGGSHRGGSGGKPWAV